VAVLAAALAGLPAERIRALAEPLLPPLSDEAHARQTHHAKMVASNVVRFGGGPVKVVRVLLEGVRQGGDLAELLRQAGATLDDMDESAVALRLVDAAVALEPAEVGHEYTRALVRMSLGDPDGADACIARLADGWEPARVQLAAYRHALFSDLSGAPGEDPRLPLAEQIAPLLAYRVRADAPPLPLVARAIRQGATRIVHARTVLEQRFGERPWLPPDLSHLLPDGPEEVELPDGEAIGLLHVARRDVLRLRWLCWSFGVDGIAIPEQPTPDPSRPSRALAWVVLARALQLQNGEADVRSWLEGAPEDEAAKERLATTLAEQAPQSTWFGLPLAALDDAQRDFAFEDELLLFRMLLQWWSSPGERTFYDPEDADEDEDDDEEDGDDDDDDDEDDEDEDEDDDEEDEE